MKKRITLSLFIILLLVFLTACSCSCKKDSGKIQLRIGFWPENTETKDLLMYETWKQAFEADYPEYEIIADHYTYSTDTVSSKYLTNTLPTVFQTWFTEPLKLVKNKYIRSIDTQLKELGWDQYMDEDMKATLTFDNKIYGVPRDGYGLGLLINTKTFVDNDLLETDSNGKAILYDPADGHPLYPTTLAEIKAASETIAEYTDTKGILICSANKTGGWQFSNLVWNAGYELETVEANGKVKANLNNAGSREVLDWIRQMKSDDLLLNSPSIVYDQWYNAIGEQVAMAIVGSDVLQLAKTQGNIDMSDLAFVPMPTVDGTHHYSLYGGTPYVFSSKATDEQVVGCLKFFEYIGRGPIISETSKAAMVSGHETAKLKNQPILPTIYPWTNNEYVEYTTQLENEYVTVDMYYYEEFFNTIKTYKHAEVQYAAQEMYEYLDNAIQSVLMNPDTVNVNSLLETANTQLQTFLDRNYNK